MTTSERPAEHGLVAFDAPGLLAHLEGLSDAQLDGLGFGVIAFGTDDLVVAYNRFESERAGIPPERVLGRHLFVDVAPCTNNFMVAQRYVDEPDLDEELDYVFTFKMGPTPVRLRLLAGPGSRRRYLLIRPR